MQSNGIEGYQKQKKKQIGRREVEDLKQNFFEKLLDKKLFNLRKTFCTKSCDISLVVRIYSVEYLTPPPILPLPPGLQRYLKTYLNFSLESGFFAARVLE